MINEVIINDTGIYEFGNTVLKMRVIKILSNGCLRIKSECGGFIVDNVRKSDWIRQNAR